MATGVLPEVPGGRRRLLIAIAAAVLGLGLLVQTYIVIQANPGDVITGVGGIFDIIRRGVPPDGSILQDAVYQSLVTVDVAIAGTLIPLVASLVLAFWAARN